MLPILPVRDDWISYAALRHSPQMKVLIVIVVVALALVAWRRFSAPS